MKSTSKTHTFFSFCASAMAFSRFFFSSSFSALSCRGIMTPQDRNSFTYVPQRPPSPPPLLPQYTPTLLPTTPSPSVHTHPPPHHPFSLSTHPPSFPPPLLPQYTPTLLSSIRSSAGGSDASLKMGGGATGPSSGSSSSEDSSSAMAVVVVSAATTRGGGGGGGGRTLAVTSGIGASGSPWLRSVELSESERTPLRVMPNGC